MLEMLKERPWAILTADLPRSPSARVKTNPGTHPLSLDL